MVSVHVIWLALAGVALIGLTRLHAHWMVGRAAVPARDSIDEAVGAGPVPAHVDPPRDRYGRFISPKSWRAPVPSRDREGLARASARPGETRWSPAELLGVSPRYEKKATPFVPPGDLTNTDALQLALRAWVLENLTTMVNNPRNSLWGVFNVLQRTWAVDQLALRAQALSAGMVGRAAVPAEDSASAKRVAQPSLAVKDSESATSSDRPIFGGHGGPPHQMSPPAATPAAVGHESIIPTERAGSPRSGTPSAFRLWPSALPDMPLDPRPETLDPVFQPP